MTEGEWIELFREPWEAWKRSFVDDDLYETCPVCLGGGDGSASELGPDEGDESCVFCSGQGIVPHEC